MFVFNQKTSRQSQIRCTLIFMLNFEFFFSIFYFDVIVFALFTVRTYDAWRVESNQKHFQKLLFDFIKLWKDNKILKKWKIAKQQNVWKSNAYKFVNKIFNKIFNYLLMIAFSHQHSLFSHLFLIFSISTIARFNII